MKRYGKMKRYGFFVLLACLFIGTAHGEDVPEINIDELIQAMSVDDLAARSAPKLELQQWCNAAAMSSEQRRVALQRMLDKLDSAPAPARCELIKNLGRIGDASVVDKVATALESKDPLVFDEARRALARIGDDKSVDALLDAIETEKDATRRASLVLAAGWRRNTKAAEPLSGLLSAKDACVAIAAAEALGRIACPCSVDALKRTVGASTGQLQLRSADSLLRCADTLLAAGQRDKAHAIFAPLADDPPCRAIKLAALAGKIKSSSDPSGLIVAGLESDDADAKDVAAGSIAELPADQLERLFVGYDRLSVSAQVTLVDSLAVTANPIVLEKARNLARNPDQKVRRSAVRALGYSKDAADVDVLIKVWRSNDDSADAARKSLGRISATGSDERIVAAFESCKSDAETAGLIDLVRERGIVGANAQLLKLVVSDDPTHRSKAMATLGQVGRAGELSGMIAGLLRTERGRDNEDAQRAITSICDRIGGDDKAKPLLDAVGSEKELIAVLPAVGRIGGPSAMAAIEEAIADSGTLRETGVRALCNWPNADPADRLLELATSASESNYRVWALRAFVRVIPLPGGNLKTNAKKLDAFKKAMELAARDDERLLVLDRVKAIRTVEALRFVLPYLDKEPYVQQACKTVVELSHHRDLREPNKEIFYPALDKVIEKTKEDRIKDRAKRYRANQV